MLSASPLASSSAVAAHQRPRWTSPRAAPLLPTTTMPSALSSLRPRPRTKTRMSAHQWCLKARALAHSRTVPVNLPQPPCCCHRDAAIALCAAAVLRAAATATDAAAAAVPPPSFCRRRAGVLLPPPQHLGRCAPPQCFALPPPPLTLPPPPCRRQASANVALLRCRHRH
jgi:hypothetical protein